MQINLNLEKLSSKELIDIILNSAKELDKRYSKKTVETEKVEIPEQDKEYKERKTRTPFSKKEIKFMKEEIKNGSAVTYIAEVLKRPYNSVFEKVRKLKLLENGN